MGGTELKSERLSLTLTGHLTRSALDNQLASVTERFVDTQGRLPLLVDCLTMRGYDKDARERFISWNREHSQKLSRVAVVTEKQMWHLVVSVMALVSEQQIKAFNDRVAAERWLAES